MTDEQKSRMFTSFLKIKKNIPLLFTTENINFTEYIALSRIKDGDANPNLPHNLHINKSAVSQMLTNLEQKNLIIRVPNKLDKRKLDNTLTEKGEFTLMQIKEKKEKLVSKLFSQLGEEKSLLMLELIEEFSQIIERIDKE